MAVNDVECEHDGVLGLVEVGNDVDVHCTDNHSDTSQHKQETQLYTCQGREE